MKFFSAWFIWLPMLCVCLTTLRRTLRLLCRRCPPSMHLWLHLLAVPDRAAGPWAVTDVRVQWGEFCIDKRSSSYVAVYAVRMSLARERQLSLDPGPALPRCWRSLAAHVLRLWHYLLFWCCCVFQTSSLPVCPSRLSVGWPVPQTGVARVCLCTSSQDWCRADRTAASPRRAETRGSETV